MVFSGDKAFSETEVMQQDDQMVEIDDALEEINEVPIVMNLQAQMEAKKSEYKMLTRSQLRSLTNGKDLNELATGSKKLSEYMIGGLD